MLLIVHGILLLWLVVVPWACSWRIPRHLVIGAAFLLGLLFLPMVDEFGEAGKPDRDGPFAAIMLPGLALTKLKVTGLAVLLGVLLTDLKRVSQFRPSWLDLPMVVWCLCPIPSLLGSPPPEGKEPLQVMLAQSFGLFLVWGVPYFMGRLYFDNLARLRDLAFLFVAGALLYVPFCIYEMRMSPILHVKVYGFAQHEFIQNVRFGGYRPMVFMQHGLALALFMVAATLMASVLWWSGAAKNLLSARWPMLARCFPYLVLLLLATTILSRSTGALVLGLVGLTVIGLSIWPRTMLPLLCLWLACPLYLSTRTSGAWSGTSVVPFLNDTVGADRAHSFVFRQVNEDELIDKALEAPPFGWGGWGRNLVHNKAGQVISTVDGLWIIVLGERGVPGLIALWLAMLLPVARFLWLQPVCSWMEAECAGATCCALVVAIYMIDNLMNNMTNPVFILMAGGLAALSRRVPVAPLPASITDKRVFLWSLSVTRLRRSRLLQPPAPRN